MGWISPFGIFKRSLLQVNKNGCCTDILIVSGYHSCDDQAGVARIIIGTLSLRTLLRTFGIMQNGEKHKDSSGTNFVGRHLLLGSMDLASTKSKSWSDKIIWKQIDVSLGLPSVDRFWNDWGASFHSEESELFIDSQSAVTFSLLGRYSAVRVIPH